MMAELLLLDAQSGVLPSELSHHLCVLAGDDDLPVEAFEAVAELVQSGREMVDLALLDGG